ncbi:MAG: hypothetical protein DCC75_11090 [Proteobacteria bacterium]|nr:MAG: hypothetical protein DCC75_11090 [Pseudomonadota bacterium]
MDNGEVIPGLNEDWTLGGAKLFEWIAGFTMLIVCSELLFDNVGRHMPHLLIIWVTTTFSLAALRRTFPDEERGIRNFCLTTVGIEPPDIPAPASLQPYWSGAPKRAMSADTEYNRMGLAAIFPDEEERALIKKLKEQEEHKQFF